MKLKKYLPLLFIVALAGFLRFYRLGELPVSPNWDEVSHGYNAYSILKTGHDEWGLSFPLIFRAFGDYKLPFYIYLTILPVWAFGLNVFAIRFISALAGTLAIPGIYLLARQLFPSEKHQSNLYYFPLISAFLLAVSPWHFFISRPALEANLSLTLLLYGFYYLLRFFEKSSSLLPAVTLLGLSLHTYNTARVFVPLLVICSFIIYRSSLTKPLILLKERKNILAIFLALLFSGLVIFQVYLGEGTARYEKLKILSATTVFQIGEKRSLSTLPPVVAKLIYNRPIYFLTAFSKNYLSYFSPSFFSQNFGSQTQFAIPHQSLLTLPVFLLAFLGFFAYFKRLKNRTNFQFLYFWLLLSPVAASLTQDPPQAIRPNPMIPALIIFASLGLWRILLLLPEKVKIFVYSVLILWIMFSFGIYLQNYSDQYKNKYSSSWQYGYQEVMDYIQKHQSEYDRIFITKRYGEPHIFYAFYTKLSPLKLQPGLENIRFNKSDWFWTDKVDNVYFVNDWSIPTIEAKTLPLENGGEVSLKNSLLITSPGHVPVNAHIIETINTLDGQPAFIITSVP